MMAVMGAGAGVGSDGVADREPEAVGRGHGELILLCQQQHTHEDRPRFIGGGGKGHLLDHFAEIAHLELHGAVQVHRLTGREFLGVDALDVVGGRAAAHVERLCALVEGEHHLVRREGADQIEEGASRDRSGAGLLDARRDPAADAELEIGGGEAQAPFRGIDEDVAEDRERGARRYGAGDEAEAVCELLLWDGGFHDVALLGMSCCRSITLEPRAGTASGVGSVAGVHP